MSLLLLFLGTSGQFTPVPARLEFEIPTPTIATDGAVVAITPEPCVLGLGPPSASSATYPAAVAADGPSNYWRLNDNGATANDEIGGKFGTITGGVTRGAAGALADPSNRAMAFNGVDGKITTAIMSLAPPIAFECWFNTTLAGNAPGGCNPLFGFFSQWGPGTPDDDAFNVRIEGTGANTYVAVWFTPRSGTGGWVRVSQSGVADGKWHHLALILLGGGAWASYLDGVPYTPSGALQWQGFTNRAFEIGWYAASPLYYAGTLDEVAIYPRALTAAQVGAHYSAGLATPTVIQQGIAAPTLTFGLSAPTAPTLAASGTVQLRPDPCVLAFTMPGTPGVSIDTTATIIMINGLPREDLLRKTLTITDVLDEQPNTAQFTVADTPGKTPAPPKVGDEIVIGVGSTLNREFAGHITRVDQTYEGRRDNLRWACQAIDYTRLLDRRLITARYPKQSATLIAIDLIQKFTTGFSTTHIATGLPEIDQIDFTFEAPTQALTRLAKLIGGYWYADYDRSIHFFITETADAPDDISDAKCNVRAFGNGSDLTQIRTRVLVEGYGSQAAADVDAFATSVPVDDAVFYADGSKGSGGRDEDGWAFVKTGPQYFAHLGKWAGGTGSIVRGADGPGPTGAPGAYVYGGGGGVVGTVYYKVSYKAGSAGESNLGPASNAVTGYPFEEPSTGALVGAAQGIGRLIGSYGYVVTFLTAQGETTAGTGRSTFTAQAFAPPGYGPAVSSSQFDPVGPLAGQYRYVMTYVTAAGESTPGGATVFNAQPIPTPGNGQFNVGQAANVWGKLRPGTYTYAVTFTSDLGETPIGPTIGIGISSWTPNPPSVSSWATTSPGGGVLPGDTYVWAVAFIDETNGVSYLSASSASFQVSGTSPVVIVLNIPVGPPGTSARRIYRKSAFGTGAYRWVGDQPDNLATQFTDRSPAGGADWQGGGTMGGQALINIGNTSGSYKIRTTRIYRSKRNTTSPLYLLTEVAGGTTAWYDGAPDDALTTAPPVVSTAGGEQAKVQVGNDYTVVNGSAILARRIYRTKVNTVEYHLLTEIPGNGAATYVDTTPDAGLTGVAPPYVSAAGGQNAFLSNLPQGPAGTLARRIYRTKRDGAGNAWFYVVQINDNTTRTYIDSKTDDELGEASPLTHSAGASVIAVYNIPIGPAGVTARRIYRTMAGGGVFYYLGEIADNLTTTYLDDKSDRELGEVAPDVGTLGALAGDTTLRVVSLAPFHQPDGWVLVGNQVIYYAAVNTATLTLYGIPATGNGSITVPIRGGDDVIASPMLIAVANWAPNHIKYPINRGDALNVLIIRDDAAAQAALAAVEGGDGVHEYLVQDERLSIASCITRAKAELAQFGNAEKSLSFTSRDPKLRSGKSITVNLGAPTNVAGTFKIQQVIITGFDIPGKLPLRTVTASNYLYSFEHLLRRVELGA